MLGDVDALFELNDQLEKLADADPVVRREAALRLGKLQDTTAIPALVRAYRNDGDKKVKKAAEEALKNFRRLESSQTKIYKPSGLLRTVRNLLTVLLLITILANVGIIAYSLWRSNQGLNVETNSLTSMPREKHWAAFQQRIEQLRSEAVEMRRLGIALQGPYLTNSKPTCERLPDTKVELVTLNPADIQRYTDIESVNQLINQAVQRFQIWRINYQNICAASDVNGFKSQMDQVGGASGLVTEIDSIVNQALDAANRRLNEIRANPAPTIEPGMAPATATLPPLAPTAAG